MKKWLKSLMKALFPFAGYVRVLEDENQRLRETNQLLLDKLVTLTTGSPLTPRPMPQRQPHAPADPNQPFHRGKADPYALLTRMSEQSMERYMDKLKAETEPLPVGSEVPLSDQN